jgi:hypothetical protein
MTPRFADATTWAQAELLMQPALIRVIDNIRKQLEQSTWRGTYHDVQIWPTGTSPADQAEVIQLQKELETASPEHIERIHQRLDQLPRPFPGYELCLSYANQQIYIDLWHLCYQVCFQEFSPAHADGYDPIVVDQHLIDETGDVDWHQLDEKAKQLVEQIFNELPTDTRE